MKIIKLTSFNDDGDIYINIDHIGDFFDVEPEYDYRKVKQGAGYTRVGVTTHNNGGFRVRETAIEILNMINDIKG